MNNLNMASLMQMLSKMDKKDLEAGIAKANQILLYKNKNDVINELNKNIVRIFKSFIIHYYTFNHIFF